MALIGGGGAGNVAGGNPSGTGTSLNYILNRVYAYSGSVPITNEIKDMLIFNTGSELIEANVNFSNTTESLSSGTRTGMIIKFNSEIILDCNWIFSNNTNYQYALQPIPLIIPPYTAVIIQGQSSDDDAIDFNAIVTGRIIDA